MRLNVLAGILVVVILFYALPAGAERREAHLYAITTWDGGCAGSARSWWDNMGDAWYDEITRIGVPFGPWCIWGHCDDAYSRDRRMVNGSISNRKFVDPDVLGCGRDWLYVDDADAAMLCMHGGDDGGYWRGSLRTNDGCDDCRIDARDELRVGDYDLEFLHLSSCHSLDDNMIFNAWRLFRDPDDSPYNGRRLHQLDGFHGCMWIGFSFVSDYEDFADDAFDMSIKDAWMDNMYRTNINGVYTQCPVAYAVGSNCADCLSRLGNERYDNVYSDPGSINCYCYYYYSNCDPACEDPWGSDMYN